MSTDGVANIFAGLLNTKNAYDRGQYDRYVANTKLRHQQLVDQNLVLDSQGKLFSNASARNKFNASQRSMADANVLLQGMPDQQIAALRDESISSGKPLFKTVNDYNEFQRQKEAQRLRQLGNMTAVNQYNAAARGTNYNRQTAVVDGHLVDSQTGQNIYTDPSARIDNEKKQAELADARANYNRDKNWISRNKGAIPPGILTLFQLTDENGQPVVAGFSGKPSYNIPALKSFIQFSSIYHYGNAFEAYAAWARQNNPHKPPPAPKPPPATHAPQGHDYWSGVLHALEGVAPTQPDVAPPPAPSPTAPATPPTAPATPPPDTVNINTLPVGPVSRGLGSREHPAPMSGLDDPKINRLPAGAYFTVPTSSGTDIYKR